MLFIREQFKSLSYKVRIVSCEAVKENIINAISKMRLKESQKKFYPDEIIDPIELFKKGYLNEYHKCPGGGVYKINRYGEVYCTFHSETE